MSITGDGGVLVQPPACVPARYGLLSVAEVEDRPEGHWQTGIEYELATCDDLFVVTPKCNQVTPDLTKEVDGGTVSSDNFADPFTMVAAYKCATGGRAVADAWKHAGDRLDRGEARTLERTFWTGVDKAGNAIRQSLQGATDLTPAAGAVSITDGLAVLESWAGENYPCQPIVHAQRGLGVYLAERQIIGADGQVMRSLGTGSRVVIGGGYLATGPDGTEPDAGESWVYVTGSLKVVRGPVFFTPERGNEAAAVDRTINDVTVFAERTYAIQQDCIVGAIRVNNKFLLLLMGATMFETITYPTRKAMVEALLDLREQGVSPIDIVENGKTLRFPVQSDDDEQAAPMLPEPEVEDEPDAPEPDAPDEADADEDEADEAESDADEE